MLARSILIAAAVTLGAGSAFAAEPTKAPRPESAEQQQQQDAAAPVLMASANIEHAAAVVPAAATDGAAPAKRPRKARVTTCRCADTPNQ